MISPALAIIFLISAIASESLSDGYLRVQKRAFELSKLKPWINKPIQILPPSLQNPAPARNSRTALFANLGKILNLIIEYDPIENRRLLKSLHSLDSDLSFPMEVRFRKGKVFYITRPISMDKNSILYEGYRLVGAFKKRRMFLKSYIQSTESNAARNFFNDIAKYDAESKIIAVDPQFYLIALESLSDARKFYQDLDAKIISSRNAETPSNKDDSTSNPESSFPNLNLRGGEILEDKPEKELSPDIDTLNESLTNSLENESVDSLQEPLYEESPFYFADYNDRVAENTATYGGKTFLRDVITHPLN